MSTTADVIRACIEATHRRGSCDGCRFCWVELDLPKLLVVHDALVEALEAVRPFVADESGVVYGVFPGGDPREFTPDPECCSDEEMEAHRLACIEWDEGRGIDRGPGCATMGDGSVWTGTGFGIGTYTYESEELRLVDDALRRARGES